MQIPRIKISRGNPALIVVAVDMSGSMASKIDYNGVLMSKSKALTTIINSFIDELIYRSQRGSEYRDYFELAIFGYCRDEVFSLLNYVGVSRDIFTVSDLINSDVKRRFVVKRRIGVDGKYYSHAAKVNCWVEECSMGNTPTYKALSMVYKVVKNWLKYKNWATTPMPMIIHITDGEATDADPNKLLVLSDKIKSLTTAAGMPIFVNVHLSSTITKPVIFPQNIDELDKDNKIAQLLFNMSSDLPEELYRTLLILSSEGYTGREVAKAVAYNIGIDELAKILSVGTSTMR